jgi:hypothetical protein
MKHPGLLAIIPFIGMFAGPVFHNAVTPFIFGMPFLLGWTVIWVLLTSVIMALVYLIDPHRKAADAGEAP